MAFPLRRPRREEYRPPRHSFGTLGVVVVVMLLSQFLFGSVRATMGVVGRTTTASIWMTTTTSIASAQKIPMTTSEDDEEEEKLLVEETIQAGRGDRDAQGIRDQWDSTDHLNVRYDSRKPISAEVEALLQKYRLTCDGCDHAQAVQTIQKFVKELKNENEPKGSSQTVMVGTTVILAILVVAGVYRSEVIRAWNRWREDELEGFSPAQRAAWIQKKRDQALQAATKRMNHHQQQQPETEAPTWLDQERTQNWTPKQERQFQKALKEFSGVPKKEKYKLIAEQVTGKSRIECLTHHRLQEYMAKNQPHQER